MHFFFFYTFYSFSTQSSRNAVPIKIQGDLSWFQESSWDARRLVKYASTCGRPVRNFFGSDSDQKPTRNFRFKVHWGKSIHHSQLQLSDKSRKITTSTSTAILPVWIGEGSLVKFANKFPESLLCSDSAHFTLVCLVFWTKRVAHKDSWIVKSRHFQAEVKITQNNWSPFTSSRENEIGGKSVECCFMIGWRRKSHVNFHNNCFCPSGEG